MTTDPAPTGATRVRTGGPKALTFSGVALLLVAIGLAVVSTVSFVGLLPLGMLSADGRPGPDAIGSTSAPGTVDLELEAGTDYAVWLLGPAGTTPSLDGPPAVRGPSGDAVRVSAVAQVSGQATRGGTSARTVGGFRANETGTHTLTVPEASSPSSTVMVTEDQAFGSFMAGIFGTVFGVISAVLVGIIGVGMTIGGGIWWHFRRKAGGALHPG